MQKLAQHYLFEQHVPTPLSHSEEKDPDKLLPNNLPSNQSTSSNNGDDDEEHPLDILRSLAKLAPTQDCWSPESTKSAARKPNKTSEVKANLFRTPHTSKAKDTISISSDDTSIGEVRVRKSKERIVNLAAEVRALNAKTSAWLIPAKQKPQLGNIIPSARGPSSIKSFLSIIPKSKQKIFEQYRFSTEAFYNDERDQRFVTIATIGAYRLPDSINIEATKGNSVYHSDYNTVSGIISRAWITNILTAPEKKISGISTFLTQELRRAADNPHLANLFYPSFNPLFFTKQYFHQALQSATIGNGAQLSDEASLSTCLTVWHFIASTPTHDALQIPRNGLEEAHLSQIWLVIKVIFADPIIFVAFPPGILPFLLFSPFAGKLLCALNKIQSVRFLQAWTTMGSTNPKTRRRLTIAILFHIGALINIFDD